MRYNLRQFTDTNSVICKIIVGAIDYHCHCEGATRPWQSPS